MIKFVKNIDELNKILKTVDDADCNYKLYHMGYTALYRFTDENGETEDYETMKCEFVVDYSGDRDDAVRAKAFIEIEKQYFTKPCLEILVDRVNETIDLVSSEKSSIHLYDFWNTAALSKAAAEIILDKMSA